VSLKEAWEYLGRLWRERAIDQDGDASVLVGASKCHGLCACMDQLLGQEMIDARTYRIMLESLDDLPRTDGYVWSLDAHGADQRAMFCERAASA